MLYPKSFREFIGEQTTLRNVSESKTLFRVPSVTISDELFPFDDYLSYSIAICVDEEGSKIRQNVDEESVDSPWWEGTPLYLNIYLEVHREGNQTDFFETVCYTEEPAGRLASEDYTSLVLEGVHEIVEDMSENA